MGLNIGDKVKHINTGNHIYIVKKVNNEIVCTLEKPKELWNFINNRLTIKDAVCRIENLIKIENGNIKSNQEF